MNLFKIYSALTIVLVMCTYNAEGGIILLLLLKIIALKGALFFGMPLAIGSFMMGQGMGFFGGSLFGGYSMLNAAHKYHSSKHHGHKHKGISLFKAKGHHHVHHTSIPTYGVPGGGWGWGSRVATDRPGGWKSPTVHYHTYNHNEHKLHVAEPSLLSKITSLPSRIVNRFKPKPQVVIPVNTYGDQGGWSSSPVLEVDSGSYGGGWSNAESAASAPVHASSYGKNPGIHTYYEDAHAGNEYGGTAAQGVSSSNMDDVDWSQGLQNLLKAAEAQAEAEAATASPSSYKDTHQESYGAAPSASNFEYSQGPTSSSASEYGAPAETAPGPSEATQGEGYYDPNTSNSYYDRDGLASEESLSVASAPNSVIEKFLENKLRAEMEKQKNAAEKKETAQLISMLRQVYIQELVDSLDGDKTGKRGVRMAETTTELPDFIPFPGVPNSTTEKPKLVQLTTLKPQTTSSSTTERESISSTTSGFNPDSDTSVESPPKSPFVRAHQNGYLVGGDTEDVQGSIASSAGVSSGEEPTKFVPMKTSWVINKRQLEARVLRNRRRQQILQQRLRSNAASASNYNLLANSVRSRRQTGSMDAAALSTFTDDVKKFFLLVSILDQDKCLQKLVCDVHTRPPGAQLTPYESNILVTFKVMNVLLPSNVEDATTNYRKAAKIGELSKAASVCAKAYPTCTYSVSQIINMGNQVAETGDVDSVVSGIASPKVDDMETGASDVQVKTATAAADEHTAMPRV